MFIHVRVIHYVSSYDRIELTETDEWKEWLTTGGPPKTQRHRTFHAANVI